MSNPTSKMSLNGLGLLSCLVAVGCVLCAAGQAQADLLAYEPFAYADVPVPANGEYAVGSEDAGIGLLGGQNPTIGPTVFYNGPWMQSGGDSQVVKALPSLSYPNFQPGIGGVQRETIQFDCCSFGRSARAIGDSGLGGGRIAQTIYESFLIDFGNQGTDAPTDHGKRGHELWSGGVGDSFLAVELFVNHFSGVNDLTLAVTTPSGTTSVPVSGGGLNLAALAGTHLVVMKYEFNPENPDVVSVYLDPTSSVEPLASDAQVSVAASDLFITHQGAFTNFTFSGSGHVPGGIDEIRWGDTFLDVTPFVVPEPTSCSLLALSIVGLIVIRRRSKRSS